MALFRVLWCVCVSVRGVRPHLVADLLFRTGLCSAEFACMLLFGCGKFPTNAPGWPFLSYTRKSLPLPMRTLVEAHSHRASQSLAAQDEGVRALDIHTKPFMRRA